jgi:hypothetical protein
MRCGASRDPRSAAFRYQPRACAGSAADPKAPEHKGIVGPAERKRSLRVAGFGGAAKHETCGEDVAIGKIGLAAGDERRHLLAIGPGAAADGPGAAGCCGPAAGDGTAVPVVG